MKCSRYFALHHCMCNSFNKAFLWRFACKLIASSETEPCIAHLSCIHPWHLTRTYPSCSQLKYTFKNIIKVTCFSRAIYLCFQWLGIQLKTLPTTKQFIAFHTLKHLEKHHFHFNEHSLTIQKMINSLRRMEAMLSRHTLVNSIKIRIKRQSTRNDKHSVPQR
jgi:hypothetical protein